MLVSFSVTAFFSLIRDAKKARPLLEKEAGISMPFAREMRGRGTSRKKIYSTSSAYQINEPACDAVMMTEYSAFHDIWRQYGGLNRCPAER